MLTQVNSIGQYPRSSTTPTEQLQEAIATAGLEQHGPSEQKQKKKARGQGGSGNRYYDKGRAAGRLKFEEKRIKFEAENEWRREKDQRDHDVSHTTLT